MFIKIVNRKAFFLKKSLALLVFAVVLLATGCSGNSAFVGKWVTENGDYAPADLPSDLELYNDGTGICEDLPISWKIEGKRFVIASSFFSGAYNYTLSNSKLTLTNDDNISETYVKDNGTQANTAATPSPTLETSPENISDDTQSDGSFSSIQEVKNQPNASLFPFYILHNGRFYPLQKAVIAIDTSYFNNSDELYCASHLPENELPVIDTSAGDQLVCINDDGKDSYPIYNMYSLGYCLPVIWGLGQPLETMASMEGIINNGGGVDDISGEPITRVHSSVIGTSESNLQPGGDSFLQAIGKLNINIMSVGYTNQFGAAGWNEFYIMTRDFNDVESPKEVTIGQYSGTDYSEQTYSIDATLYSLEGAWNSPVERTKDGYFVLNIDALIPPAGGESSYAIYSKWMMSTTATAYGFILSNSK